MVGLIGGTGIGSRLAAFGGKPFLVPTPFGPLRGALVEREGLTLAVIQRHAAAHRVPPHAINYRAIAVGARALGLSACLSTAAVGAVESNLSPGGLVAPHDFIDLSGRRLTLFADTVTHTSFTVPFSGAAREALIESARTAAIPLRAEAVYVGFDGPRFETPAEIEMVRRLGGTIVGMTAASEAVAMREAGVEHACLAIVSNMAASIGGQAVEHEAVLETVHAASGPALTILFGAAQRLCR